MCQIFILQPSIEMIDSDPTDFCFDSATATPHPRAGREWKVGGP